MKLIVESFADRRTAGAVLADLADQDVNWGTPLHEAAIAMDRSKRGKVHVHTSHLAGSGGAMAGVLPGLVLDALLLTPGIFTAAGALTGGAIGEASDTNPIDALHLRRDFLKEMGRQHLDKESSALLVFVPDAMAPVVRENLRAYQDGTMVETDLSDEDTEEFLRKARR